MKRMVAAALVFAVMVLGASTAFAYDQEPAVDTNAQETSVTEPSEASDTAQDDNTTFVEVQLEESDGAETESETPEGEEAQDRRHGRRGGCHKDLGTVSEILGLSAEEVKAALEDGSTIADLAAAQGVDVDDIVDTLVAEVSDRLDEKVAEGKLTADEAAEKLAEKTQRIEDRINGVHNDNGREQGTDA